MLDKDRVLQLIFDKSENEVCDFKRQYYNESKKHDLIKDILSFSNAPTLDDKYIIFNIDDNTREICDMQKDSIPDVSEINGILREYCEPHIDIEVDTFEHKNKDIAYIKISKNNLNKPYLVKKDFSRNNKILLHQGQVYIRRNASNYRANRHDLDEIFNSREKARIEICSKISSKEATIDKIKIKLHYIQFLVENNSNKNLLINKMEIVFNFADHAFSSNVKFIDEKDTTCFSSTNDIESASFSILAYYTIKKYAYVELSDNCIKYIDSSLKCGEKYDVHILMHCEDGRKVTSNKLQI